MPPSTPPPPVPTPPPTSSATPLAAIQPVTSPHTAIQPSPSPSPFPMTRPSPLPHHWINVAVDCLCACYDTSGLLQYGAAYAYATPLPPGAQVEKEGCYNVDGTGLPVFAVDCIVADNPDCKRGWCHNAGYTFYSVPWSFPDGTCVSYHWGSLSADEEGTAAPLLLGPHCDCALSPSPSPEPSPSPSPSPEPSPTAALSRLATPPPPSPPPAPPVPPATPPSVPPVLPPPLSPSPSPPTPPSAPPSTPPHPPVAFTASSSVTIAADAISDELTTSALAASLSAAVRAMQSRMLCAACVTCYMRHERARCHAYMCWVRGARCHAPHRACTGQVGLSNSSEAEVRVEKRSTVPVNAGEAMDGTSEDEYMGTVHAAVCRGRQPADCTVALAADGTRRSRSLAAAHHRRLGASRGRRSQDAAIYFVVSVVPNATETLATDANSTAGLISALTSSLSTALNLTNLTVGAVVTDLAATITFTQQGTTADAEAAASSTLSSGARRPWTQARAQARRACSCCAHRSLHSHLIAHAHTHAQAHANARATRTCTCTFGVNCAPGHPSKPSPLAPSSSSQLMADARHAHWGFVAAQERSPRHLPRRSGSTLVTSLSPHRRSSTHLARRPPHRQPHLPHYRRPRHHPHHRPRLLCHPRYRLHCRRRHSRLPYRQCYPRVTRGAAGRACRASRVPISLAAPTGRRNAPHARRARTARPEEDAAVALPACAWRAPRASGRPT